MNKGQQKVNLYFPYDHTYTFIIITCLIFLLITRLIKDYSHFHICYNHQSSVLRTMSGTQYKCSIKSHRMKGNTISRSYSFYNLTGHVYRGVELANIVLKLLITYNIKKNLCWINEWMNIFYYKWFFSWKSSLELRYHKWMDKVWL